MRLLQLSSHGELSLTKDFGNDAPPYAILSHTWNENNDEEVTFCDVENKSGTSKAGHAKLQFCGKQAQKDGLEYFWVDTCCINKANNAELSEAINSMFRWYCDAVKCYVYLSDVSARKRDYNGQNERTWKSGFLSSRWFKRGWTLQELIAPASVQFFSREGEWLGDKSSLEGQIHDITQIPITALRGTPLSDFSVDERKRWTAERETKKTEDKAYCLLGIFNVFMPPIYGEGDHAFIRLEEAIKKRSGEESSPPTQTPPVKAQTPQLKSQMLPLQTIFTQGSPTAKATPESTLKALPSVRDHTSSELGPEGDEYIPREFDEEGDKKVDSLGYPQGGRLYKMKTFTLPGRGEKLFMLATECARVLAYRDSYLLFNKNRSLHKIIASQEEKDNLIQQDQLPYAYRSRQIAIVTARSMFRLFGSRVIQQGRRVRDDYWEAKARKQGFTEEDAAGEKRPGATKAKEAAAAVQLDAIQSMFQPSDIVFSTSPGFGVMQPPPMHSGIALTMAPLPVTDAVHNRYGEIQRPRQDITGAGYGDTTRTSNDTELMSQATHAAEFSKQLKLGRDFRKKMLEEYWQRPYDPPVSTPPPQSAEPVPAPVSQPFSSPRYPTTDFTSSQSGMHHQQQSSQQGMNPPPPSYQHPSTMQQSPLVRPDSQLQANPLQQYGQPQLYRASSIPQSRSQYQGYSPSPHPQQQNANQQQSYAWQQTLQQKHVDANDDHPGVKSPLLETRADVTKQSDDGSAFERFVPLIALPQVQEVLQDPETHDRKLLDLEIRIYERFAEAGIFAINWRHQQDVLPFLETYQKTQLVGEAAATVPYLETFLARISGIQNGFDVLGQALLEIKDVGDSHLLFSILVRDPERKAVCNVVPIALSTIDAISACLTRMSAQIKRCFRIASETKDEGALVDLSTELLPTLKPLETTVDTALDFIGLKFETTLAQDRTGKQRVVQTLAKAALLLRILAAGIVSYVSSHTGDLRDTLFSDGAGDGLVLAELDGQKFSICRRKLACLAEFVGGSIMVITTDEVDEQLEQGYALSTLLADLDDLWGPLNVAYALDGFSKASEVLTLGGKLVGVDGTFPNNFRLQGAEILCHWYAWNDQQFERRKSHHISFDPMSLLLIGATPPKFRENVYCDRRRQSYFKTWRDGVLDTYDSESEKAGGAIALQLGIPHIAGLSATRSSRVIPGANAKNAIISWFVDTPLALRSFEPPIACIDEISALEISKCTGNAQRVSLWELLRSPEVIDYTENLSMSNQLCEKWHAFETFQSFWKDRLVTHSQKSAMVEVLCSVLRYLKLTGVDKNGDLVAWHASESEVRIIRPTWAPMLIDSKYCATFAILSRRCLVYDQGRNCFNKTMTSYGEFTLMTRISITAEIYVDGRRVLPHNFAAVQQADCTERTDPGHHSDDPSPGTNNKVPTTPAPAGRTKNDLGRKYAVSPLSLPMQARQRCYIKPFPLGDIDERIKARSRDKAESLTTKLADLATLQPQRQRLSLDRSELSDSTPILPSIQERRQKVALQRDQEIQAIQATFAKLKELHDALQNQVIGAECWELPPVHGQLTFFSPSHSEMVKFDQSMTFCSEPLQMIWQPSEHKLDPTQLLAGLDAAYGVQDVKLKKRWRELRRKMPFHDSRTEVEVLFRFQEARRVLRNDDDKTVKWICITESDDRDP